MAGAGDAVRSVAPDHAVEAQRWLERRFNTVEAQLKSQIESALEPVAKLMQDMQLRHDEERVSLVMHLT